MTDQPTPMATAQTRVVAPTRMDEFQSLLIVAAVILIAAAVVGFLGWKTWPDSEAHEVIHYLGWIALGALATLGVALLIRLSANVGTKVQTHVGLDGASLNLDRDAGA